MLGTIKGYSVASDRAGGISLGDVVINCIESIIVVGIWSGEGPNIASIGTSISMRSGTQVKVRNQVLASDTGGCTR